MPHVPCKHTNQPLCQLFDHDRVSRITEYAKTRLIAYIGEGLHIVCQMSPCPIQNMEKPDDNVHHSDSQRFQVGRAHIYSVQGSSSF